MRVGYRLIVVRIESINLFSLYPNHKCTYLQRFYLLALYRLRHFLSWSNEQPSLRKQLSVPPFFSMIYFPSTRTVIQWIYDRVFTFIYILNRISNGYKYNPIGLSISDYRLVSRKPAFWYPKSYNVRPKPDCSATETSYNLESSHVASLAGILSRKRITTAGMRRLVCAFAFQATKSGLLVITYFFFRNSIYKCYTCIIRLFGQCKGGTSWTRY